MHVMGKVCAGVSETWVRKSFRDPLRGSAVCYIMSTLGHPPQTAWLLATVRGIHPAQKPAFAFESARYFLMKAIHNLEARTGGPGGSGGRGGSGSSGEGGRQQRFWAPAFWVIEWNLRVLRVFVNKMATPAVTSLVLQYSSGLACSCLFHFVS